jgi:6,7-dimethyl-8-ribityllumazine synthase
MRIALVVSTYHRFITDRLAAGARAALVEGGVSPDAVELAEVPGAFELPQAASVIADSGRFAAVVCLGCLIRGETPHFDVIAAATAHGIMRAAQRSGVPVSFCVLTTNTADEAVARAGDGPGNKGREAAVAALEMARLYRRLAGGA